MQMKEILIDEVTLIEAPFLLTTFVKVVSATALYEGQT